jgi:general secretion pathway protein I
MMHTGSAQRGFTLMEVLVAMVILSMGLLAVIKVVSEVSISASQLQDKTYAQWVALNKVAEMRLQTTWPPIGKTDGDSEMAGQTWHWVMQVESTDDKDVRKLEVAVNPESEKDSKVATINVTAFLGRPL